MVQGGGWARSSLHAYPRRLPYAEIEIRQDLLGTAAGVEDWSRRLERLLEQARERYGTETERA